MIVVAKTRVSIAVGPIPQRSPNTTHLRNVHCSMCPSGNSIQRLRNRNYYEILNNDVFLLRITTQRTEPQWCYAEYDDRPVCHGWLNVMCYDYWNDALECCVHLWSVPNNWPVRDPCGQDMLTNSGLHSCLWRGSSGQAAAEMGLFHWTAVQLWKSKMIPSVPGGRMHIILLFSINCLEDLSSITDMSVVMHKISSLRNTILQYTNQIIV